jgi:hypothetical protein
MGQFRKYAQPPPQRRDMIAEGLSPGATQEELDMYEPMDGMGGDPFMGGGLPMPYDYGAPKQQWNAEMMDRLVDTSIDEHNKDGSLVRVRPKLWLFDTKAFRHLQLTNLRSRDQTEIERDIADIQMLSHQDGNDQLCDEIQQRVYSKIAMFKSRSDLPVQLRERDAWVTNVSELKTHEIKRPQGGSGGGFFSDLLGGGKKRRDY